MTTLEISTTEDRRPRRSRVPAIAAVCVALLWLGRGAAYEQRDVPGKLSDSDFWRLITEASEQGGSFPSENFVSNETEFQTVIPRLKADVQTGGIYVGVGPDQNFTYIAALKPAMAFIVDIRRQNLLHHLLYKALMEMSPTRADFLTRLFGRPKPKGVADNAPAGVLFAPYLTTEETPGAFDRNLRDVLGRLKGHHGFALSPSDESTIARILRIFHAHGPDIAYATSYIGTQMRDGVIVRTPMSIFPGFADLMVQTDKDGFNHAYLADESRYRTVRDMQLKNLIVPIVGDFAGPKAIRAVGAYVRARKATVTTFYTSNVEQYLFQNGVWEDYYANVASMPLDDSSRFIRAYFPSAQLGGRVYTIRPTDPPQMLFSRPGGMGFIESESLICSITDLIAAVDTGKVQTYYDVVQFSK